MDDAAILVEPVWDLKTRREVTAFRADRVSISTNTEQKQLVPTAEVLAYPDRVFFHTTLVT